MCSKTSSTMWTGTRRRYELLEQLGDKLLKNISFSYIAANIGTILKQPVSFVVAGTEIDIGANLFSAMKNHKRGLAEAIEKAPKAWKRSQGHYSPEASLIADSHEIMEVFHGRQTYEDNADETGRKNRPLWNRNYLEPHQRPCSQTLP